MRRLLKMAALKRYLGPKGRSSWWNPCIYQKNQHLPPLCVAVKKAATDTLDLPQVPHHTLPARLWWFATVMARNLGVFPSARARLTAVYISRGYQDTACLLSMASVWPASFLLPQPCLPHHDGFHKTFLYCFIAATEKPPSPRFSHHWSRHHFKCSEISFVQ